MFYAQEPDSCQKEHNGENRTAGKAAKKKKNEYRDDGEVNGGGNNVGKSTTAAITQKNITPKNTAKKNTATKNTTKKNTTKKNTATKVEYSDEGEYSVGREESTRCGGILHPSDGLIAAFYSGYRFGRDILPSAGIFPVWTGELSENRYVPPVCPVLFPSFTHKLRTGGSLLYSWDIGMGVNFAALYAYYLASPLNWLVMLCPQRIYH